jgi:hypothetical protein
MSATERKFEAVEKRCVKCDTPCINPWKAGEGETSFGKITGRLPQLGIRLVYWGEERGSCGDALTVYCWAPDRIYQADGETPRVCLIHEKEQVVEK